MKHALLLLSLIATQAQAQITYTDVIPDATYDVSGDTCHLDLDNNGQADYKLCQFTLPYFCDVCPSGTQQQVLIFPLATNGIADWTWLSQQWPQCLEIGQVIDAGLSMSETNHFIIYDQPGGTCAPLQLCVPPPSVTWALAWVLDPGSPRYLGLRFSIAGATHYGWARLLVPSASSFTLMDYAYNSVPDEAIVAGDDGSTSGITSIALRTMQVSPNPFTSTLSISLQTGTTGPVSSRVLSLTGQALLTRTVAASSGPSAITLDLASLAPGTYLLEMQIGGERIVRKVVKL